MPTAPTYPGLYVQEIPSGVHPIAGVSTSDTAFVDYFPQGPVGVATRVAGFDSFLRQFGPLLDSGSPAGYAVMQFFLNGGQVAWIVRVVSHTAEPAGRTLTAGYSPSNTLVVSAINPGTWGQRLQVGVDWETPAPGTQFNLVVRRLDQIGGRTVVTASEVHRNLTMAVGDPHYVVAVVSAASTLILVKEAAGGLGQPPQPTGSNLTRAGTINDVTRDANALGFLALENGVDGSAIGATDLTSALDALVRIAPAVVNLLCIPAAATLDGSSVAATPQLASVAGAVASFCDQNRCFYLMDIPPGVDTTTRMINWLGANPSIRDRNAAVTFPRLRIVDPDPLRNGAMRDIGSSGTLAGVYARTDSARGIWKAPAGTATQLRGIAGPAGTPLNDSDSAQLNPLGVNVIRTLPVYGTVNWGARTLFGADVMTSEWAYVPVRRTAMYIEESLAQGLRWVVFEPNDEPLWAQIRLNVGSFMQSMFRQGAFQGATPREAYLVKCDSETTTQADIDRGIVNILVGFAPLKPAEFVFIQLQQLTQPPDQ
ncbi:phage tail sheath family protein [Nakamurella sp.]|uniref:phage tail sheath family protein n=1 Tax=Nakamurella sp. TaxID=1869182 RepID=UPI003B3AB176